MATATVVAEAPATVTIPQAEVVVKKKSKKAKAKKAKKAGKGFWNQTKRTLRKWGRKAAGGGKKARRGVKKLAIKAKNAVVNGFRWLWTNKATQWVVTKTKLVWSKIPVAARKVWGWAKRPITWALASVAALGLAPKLVWMLLFVTVVVFFSTLIYFITKRITDSKNPQQLWENVHPKGIEEKDKRKKARATAKAEAKKAKTVEVEIDITDEVLNQTLEQRYTELQRDLDVAIANDQVPLAANVAGRAYLIKVRAGRQGDLANDSGFDQIYRAACKEIESEQPMLTKNRRAIRAGIQAEQGRLDALAEERAKVAATVTA